MSQQLLQSEHRIVVDMYCGAGGTSSGCADAFKEKQQDFKLIAINHNEMAIATHTRNHPWAVHLQEDIDNLVPKKVVPGGKVFLLVASPECTHHSNARGGRPMNDQSRSQAFQILKWANDLDIENILVENVREFMTWGPLGKDGRPIKEKKGTLFQHFIGTLEDMGYVVEHRVLNAADYGDATTRRRLFIQARKHTPIIWPEPTHSADGQGKKKWRAAREIIDWTIEGKSIFGRKKPLSPNTMRRILVGMEKFCGDELKPFLVMLYKSSNAADIEKPCPTLTTVPKVGLAKPFLTEYYGNGKAQDVDRPLPTQGTRDRFSLIQPFVMKIAHQRAKPEHAVKSVDSPLPTIMASKEELGVVQPYLVEFKGGKEGDNRTKSIEDPLPTQGCSNAFGIAQPFIVPNFGEREGQTPRTHSIDDPLPAVTSAGAGCLVVPMVLGQQSCAAARPVSEPVPTISTAGAIGLIQPEYDGYRLDIKFRMLQPHELAGAMSLDNYSFVGKKKDIVRQIGNAVPRQLARNLCLTYL